jgi:RNA 2',3'-cyclic 3'-phosphodiesterase
MSDTASDDKANNPPPLRLFTALWPDDATRDELSRWRDAMAFPAAARPAAKGKLHLTLHFIGEFPAERLTELAASLPPMKRAFELRLTQVQAWRGGLVVFCPKSTPVALQDLYEEQRVVLQRLGVLDDNRPFRPHVTLARDCPTAPRVRGSIEMRWRVAGHALVQSLPDGRYQVLERFALF